MWYDGKNRTSSGHVGRGLSIWRQKEDNVRILVWSVLAALAALSLLLVAGCSSLGPAESHVETVELGGAETVDVLIDMGVGALLIGGGAQDLLEAEFTYSQETWKPEVSYQVTGTQGFLSVKQPSAVGVAVPNVQYEWDLRLNSEVPMDAKIHMGVGGGSLDLGDLNLQSLELDLGVGGAEVDLTGSWEADLEANIHSGVGGLKLVLPRDVGVRVEAEAGLGAVEALEFNRDGDVYTNDAYGQTDVTLEIRAEVGVGGLELDLGG
jgi:hypothetical protein